MLIKGSKTAKMLLDSARAAASTKAATISCAVGVACVAILVSTMKHYPNVNNFFSPMDAFAFGDHGCLDSWPPQAECVVEILPYGLGLLVSCLALNLASFLLETPSEGEMTNVKDQHERRHPLIEEMV